MWSILVNVPHTFERPHTALLGGASYKHPSILSFGSASQISYVLIDFRIVPSVIEMRLSKALSIFTRHVF